MAQGDWIALRPLPDGEFRQGAEAGWQGRILDIDFVDQSATADLTTGIPVEVRSEGRLYLGVLQERRLGHVSIHVEHCLDRGQVESIREVWG